MPWDSVVDKVLAIERLRIAETLLELDVIFIKGVFRA